VADLVVHGGVLALDRVQQVVWTLIALGMFVRITVSTYATAEGLPDIPNDLLMLMGLSSAGYLGGKIVRGAGPVIDEVIPREGSLSLIIKGKHLSKEAFVWVDGAQVTKVTATADDPADPTKFATELQVPLDISMADWWAQEHAITVINNDAQRAEWRTTAKILDITPGEPAGGQVTLTVKSAYARKGATIVVKDTSATSKQDESNPNLFTVTGIPADWVNSPHDVTIKSGDRESTFKYTPATADGGGDPGGGDPGGGQGEGEQGGGQGEGQQGGGQGEGQQDVGNNAKADADEEGAEGGGTK
jgi:hypothetical protein